MIQFNVIFDLSIRKLSNGYYLELHHHGNLSMRNNSVRKKIFYQIPVLLLILSISVPMVTSPISSNILFTSPKTPVNLLAFAEDDGNGGGDSSGGDSSGGDSSGGDSSGGDSSGGDSSGGDSSGGDSKWWSQMVDYK